MKPVFVCGLGAVSPAGWGLAPFREALRTGSPLPVQTLPRPGRKPLATRHVPAPSSRLPFLSHPRIRRASPLTHYAAAAALEATAGHTPGCRSDAQLGLVVCLQSGCVQYSCRFFEETLDDPPTASPLLFPETVFAAPASHLATILGGAPLVSTRVGDPGCFLQGLALAAQWLLAQKVERCVVVGPQENHWLSADALWLFQHSAVFSSGAGAICLGLDERFSMGVALNAITDSHTYLKTSGRLEAARKMRAQLPIGSNTDMLCDGLDSSPRADAAERQAWANWPGSRLSLKAILGEGLMASAAWQCVAACDAIATGLVSAANVSLVGCNQQAIGARFVAATTSQP